jgi:hypothetical protein
MCGNMPMMISSYIYDCISLFTEYLIVAYYTKNFMSALSISIVYISILPRSEELYDRTSGIQKRGHQI